MNYNSFEQELNAFRQKGQYRTLNTVAQRDQTTAEVHGRRCLNLSSNDYLGLGADRRRLENFLSTQPPHELLEEFGFSSSSSRLLTGNSPAYDALEHELCDMYHAEAACVFNSGYHANIGIISALTKRNDLVLSDKLNHASIMDGLRIAAADFLRYRHLDYEHLETLLKKHHGTHRRLFIMSESVFSMDGDVADLYRLVDLKKRYDAFLILDEAHAVGVFGASGCGLCEDLGLLSEIDIIVGTFGKALASLGAYAVSRGVIKEYLVNTMRSLIFSTALPPVILHWNRMMLQTVRRMTTERRHLMKIATRLRQRLNAKQLRSNGASQIVPVLIGPNAPTVCLSEFLREQGYLIFAIRPPTVPPNTARLRLSLNAAMSWEQLKDIPGIIERYCHEHSLDTATA
ncbi:8-amino-7-oxononanoate synthase [candidate division KSB3 bacterium]|uniref:8-amino-7-oxononanoate synthase n=1 Tax=candidate division KSB3 bacterium TaxID=2044937 RepID=A0A2G6E6U6_9BACT|nr:MAG: 8-amino-7-oxononanoate synthase [candidate division KSB3 bacterium]PIE30090.1 MAG: 8-amino-7-oxononanoate synthase [candidate division KSB3 bacterium]